MTFWSILKRLAGGEASSSRSGGLAGPFAPAFACGELNVPGYFTLLHALHPGCPAVIRRVQAALGDEGAREGIPKLLAERNWRSHLVAAVAILLAENPAEFAPDLWSTVDAGSWVSPQLVATLRFIDPHFVESARQRIEQRCPSPPEREPGHEGQSAKDMAALFWVLRECGNSDAWIRQQMEDPEVNRLLRSDIDASGEIAGTWAKALQHQFRKAGVEFPRPTA